MIATSPTLDGLRFGFAILATGWGALGLAVGIRSLAEYCRARKHRNLRKKPKENPSLREYLASLNAPPRYYPALELSERGLTNLAEKCKLRHTQNSGKTDRP